MCCASHSLLLCVAPRPAAVGEAIASSAGTSAVAIFFECFPHVCPDYDWVAPMALRRGCKPLTRAPLALCLAHHSLIPPGGKFHSENCGFW
eukprot:COSAG06_NODE_31923_length_514_cov_0.518072_1_plen_90_part_01